MVFHLVIAAGNRHPSSAIVFLFLASRLLAFLLFSVPGRSVSHLGASDGLDYAISNDQYYFGLIRARKEEIMCAICDRMRVK